MALSWFPWRRLEIRSPLTVAEAREALLGNVEDGNPALAFAAPDAPPPVFRGRVGLASFHLMRRSVGFRLASLVIEGEFLSVQDTRIRLTLRLPWRAYGMLVFGVLGFPICLGRAIVRDPSGDWGLLVLAAFAFVLSGTSPAWRFHRSARWSEHALRAIFRREPVTAERPLPHRLRTRVAHCLSLSLQAVDERWHAGRLRVITPEGDCTAFPLEALLFDEDRVLMDGVEGGSAPPPVYALLNKPKHVTSTAQDPDGKRDLSEYLRQMPAGCFAVGRLDRQTTGLLLFTSDGELANAVLRPDHETTKTYWLWLDEVLAEDDARLGTLLSGVDHHGECLRAHAVRIAAQSEYATELELTLTQGKKRQVRHMCRALNLHLVHLHRKRIGPLTDEGLAVGALRFLSPGEVEGLWGAVGGRARLRARKVAALRRNAAEARAANAPLLRLERWLEDEP